MLRVQDLRTYFHLGGAVARAVDGVSFEIRPGETVGMVGESGCGKSVTALSLLRLVDPPGRIEPGSSIEFEGRDLLRLDEEGIRQIRGNRIAMVFQEPMTALNPVFTIGDQVAEVARVHAGAGVEVGAEIGDGEKRGLRHRGGSWRAFNASRKPSATRLTASTVTTSAVPANTHTHHTDGKYSMPS